MAMDGGQVSPLNRFGTNVVAAHLQCCSPAGIFKRDTPHNHASVCAFLLEEFEGFANPDLIVSAIICDGASDQTKALDCRDLGSVHSCAPCHRILARILHVPCLCHRLNNAYRRLGHISPVLSRFIASLRELAVLGSKPASRRQLGRDCPAVVRTRWLYDSRILALVLRTREAVNPLGNRAHRVEPISVALSDLLIVWSQFVTRLENSSCRLSCAYPEIERTTSHLAAIGDGYRDNVIASAYDAAIQLINEYTTDSSHDLL
jgi:hypothetical protein